MIQTLVSYNPVDKFSLCDIQVGNIGDNNLQMFYGLLEKMAVCSSRGDGDLGVTALGDMRIQVTTDQPVAYRHLIEKWRDAHVCVDYRAFKFHYGEG